MTKPTKLPKRLLVVKNPDKEQYEQWTPDRDPLNFVCPTRIGIYGANNTGKSLIVKNILMRMDSIKRIYLLHPESDGEDNEYQLMDVETIDPEELIANEDIEQSAEHSAMIIDDVVLNELPQKKLKKLFSYISSHKNLTLIITAHTFTEVPIYVRRSLQVFIFTRSNDHSSFQFVASKVGMEYTRFKELMVGLKEYESLWIDRTSKTPYPLRKNGYELISE
jgi:hypothetical protein